MKPASNVGRTAKTAITATATTIFVTTMTIRLSGLESR
jgi:hypothetical protein